MKEEIFNEIEKFLSTTNTSGLMEGLMYNINYGIFTLGVLAALLSVLFVALSVSFGYDYFSKPKNYRSRSDLSRFLKALGFFICALVVTCCSYFWIKYCIDTDRTTTKTNCEKAYKFRDVLANDKEARKLMKSNSKFKGYEERLNNFTSKKCEGQDTKMYFRFGNVIFGS